MYRCCRGSDLLSHFPQIINGYDSIGWRHGDTKVMLLDDYEGKRNHRRKLIVLTRAEREELLLNWGIAFDDIIDSIRANIRVKNQRRQTVTNLGKVERLEEAFESATRKIKRALLLRRRTGEKVKQLQQQADVAAKNVHSPPSSVSDEQQGSDTIRSDESTVKLTCTSDDKIEKSFLHDCRKVVTSEAMLVRAASSLSDIDDLHTSISGFSLDNSTTASFKDLEEFYRELELEMFGDMPLPNMVGETLEVPGLTIPEEERVYHVPQFYVGYTEAPSVTPSYAEILDESKEYHESDFPPHPSHLTQHPEMKMYFQPNPLSSASSAGQNQNKPARSILRHILEQTDEQEQDTSSGCPIESEHESQFLPTPSRQHGYILYDDPIMAIRMAQAPLPQFKLSSSLDSADLKQVEKHRANIARAYLSQAVTAMEQRYLHPSLAPPIPPTNEFGINFYPVKQRQESPPKQFQFPTHHEETCSGHSEKSCRRGSNSRRSRHREDEPLVCHIPLYTKRSLTDWMEGYDNCDFSNIHFPSHEIVTITEDMGCNDRIRPAIPYVMASGPPVYLAPPRFPQTLL